MKTGIMMLGAMIITVSVVLWSIPVAALGFVLLMYPGVHDLVEYRKSC